MMPKGKKVMHNSRVKGLHPTTIENSLMKLLKVQCWTQILSTALCSKINECKCVCIREREREREREGKGE